MTLRVSTLGGLPRPFWALWAGTLVNRMGTMVVPFTGVYLTQNRGLPVLAAGLAMAVYGAGSLLSPPLAGWSTDRAGRRETLAASMVGTAATMLLLGYSSTLPMILVAMFVLGLLAEAYRPASSALVADLTSSTDRPRAFGLLYWAINLGYAMGMTAGGWLAERGFVWLFWIDATTSVAFAVLVWRAVGRAKLTKRDNGMAPTRPPTSSANGRPGSGFGAVLGDRLMLGLTIVAFGNALVYAQTFTMLPIAMINVVGLSTPTFGLAMAVNGVLIVVFQPLVSSRLARRDPSRVFASGLLTMGAGFALTGLVVDVTGLLVTIVIWTAGEVLTAGIAGAIVAELAPPHLRGRYYGLFGLAWSTATVLAPLLGSGLLRLGSPILWFTIGGVGMLSAIGMLYLGPAIRLRSIENRSQPTRPLNLDPGGTP